MSNKIPPPIDINEAGYSINEVVNYVYSNYFQNDFMDKNKRTKLYNTFIYLDLNFIEYKPERFWHIISYNPSEEKYTVNPCVNSDDLVLCENFKIDCNNNLCIPEEAKLLDRCDCIYRLRRINWINPILKLANENDSNVKVWYEDYKDDKNNINRKVFVRFKHGIIDYLIVLIDRRLNGEKRYKFVTAYPVTHNGTKKRLNASYSEFIKGQK